jgi:hypothetical protein
MAISDVSFASRQQGCTQIVKDQPRADTNGRRDLSHRVRTISRESKPVTGTSWSVRLILFRESLLVCLICNLGP